MDVYTLNPTEYQRLLQYTLAMPNMHSWTFGKNGVTRYRYSCGRLEILSNGEWLEIKPRKDGTKCTW